jgi:ribosomal protein S18 acetylase RimI-like enzyme
LSLLDLELRSVTALDRGRADSLGGRLAAMDPWRTLGYSAKVLSQSLQVEHPDLRRHLAMRGEEIQGLAVVRHPWLRGAYIELFAVLPDCQGLGVGRAILRHLESAYQDRARNLWLLVSGFNQTARRFYERNGFKAIGTIPELVAAGQDEILMRKVLPEAAGRTPQIP